MPVSRKSSKYPNNFFALLRLTPELLPFRWTFPSKRKATATRLQIYGFIEALRGENNPGARQLDALLLRIEDFPDGHADIVIESRDNTSERAMFDAIDQLAGTHHPSVAPAATIVTPSSSDGVFPRSTKAHENAIEQWFKQGKIDDIGGGDNNG